MDTYDFASKQLYRQRRESAIDRLSAGRVETRRVAYLDTSEALDTVAYLKRGYQPENLYAINREPAELAHLTRKLKALGLPLVNTKGCGCDFDVALRDTVPEVDVIDFDGMSCLNDRLVSMLNTLVNTRPTCVYGFTILGGRETGEFRKQVRLGNSVNRTSFNTAVNPNHAQRLAMLLHTLGLSLHYEDICSLHIESVIWDCYMSISSQPMVWAVISTVPHREITAKYLYKTALSNPLLPLFPCCYKTGVLERLLSAPLSQKQNSRLAGELHNKMLWFQDTEQANSPMVTK